MNPSPIRIETTAQAQNGASICQSSDVEQRRPGERQRPEQVRLAPPDGVGDDPGRHLEQHHPGGEERVGRERLEVREPGVEQEDRVDPPDQRRGQRVPEQEHEVRPHDRGRRSASARHVTDASAPRRLDARSANRVARLCSEDGSCSRRCAVSAVMGTPPATSPVPRRPATPRAASGSTDVRSSRSCSGVDLRSAAARPGGLARAVRGRPCGRVVPGDRLRPGRLDDAPRSRSGRLEPCCRERPRREHLGRLSEALRLRPRPGTDMAMILAKVVRTLSHGPGGRGDRHVEGSRRTALPSRAPAGSAVSVLEGHVTRHPSWCARRAGAGSRAPLGHDPGAARRALRSRAVRRREGRPRGGRLPGQARASSAPTCTRPAGGLARSPRPCAGLPCGRRCRSARSAAVTSGGKTVVPTRAQERYMLYDAILNGARAVAFFGGHIRALLERARRQGRSWSWPGRVRRPPWRPVSEISAKSADRPRSRLPPTGARPSRPPTAGRRCSPTGFDPGTISAIAAGRVRGRVRVRLSGHPCWARTARVYHVGAEAADGARSVTDTVASGMPTSTG